MTEFTALLAKGGRTARAAGGLEWILDVAAKFAAANGAGLSFDRERLLDYHRPGDRVSIMAGENWAIEIRGSKATGSTVGS